jgi:aspartyl-tRNA(Asn)/glutamyl-tRNA(Gln) amidotransferase subunit C
MITNINYIAKMSLTPQQVSKIARLARLRLTDEEKAAAQQELNKIFGWIEQLKEVNTENVEPLASVVDITTRLREDIINDGNIAEEVLANSPVTPRYNHFVVPKVVE